MKIVLISDTHNKHDFIDVPEGDVLIHSGDATMGGRMEEILNFGRWFARQPHALKIFVAGNHDLMFEKNLDSAKFLLPSSITYLQDSKVVFNGVKFYGSPWQPRFFDWAFNVDRGPEIAKKWALIPEDTNVLITHGPPFGIGDLVPDYNDKTKTLNVGDEELLKRVNQLQQLKLHTFGHIHEGAGIHGKFVNASSLNGKYQYVNKPIEIEI